MQVKQEQFKGHDSLAEMVSTHIHNWRTALELEKKNHQLNFDQDNVDYMDHELSALADIEAACKIEIASSKDLTKEDKCFTST